MKELTTRQLNRTRVMNFVVIAGMILAVLFTIFFMLNEAYFVNSARQLAIKQQCMADQHTWVTLGDTGQEYCDEGGPGGYKE